jgi:hypothetical protein
LMKKTSASLMAPRFDCYLKRSSILNCKMPLEHSAFGQQSTAWHSRNVQTIWLHGSRNCLINSLLRRSPAQTQNDLSTRALTTTRRRATTTRVAIMATSAKVFICWTVPFGPAIMTNGIKCPTRTNRLWSTPDLRIGQKVGGITSLDRLLTFLQIT